MSRSIVIPYTPIEDGFENIARHNSTCKLITTKRFIIFLSWESD